MSTWQGSGKVGTMIEWNSVRLGGPTHGIVTKTVHKTLPGGVVGVGSGGGLGTEGV